MKTIDIIKEVIFEQSNIVGNKIAFERAEATKVIHFEDDNIIITGSTDEALKKLIKSYEEIFGEASVEVCEDVIKKFTYLQK